MCYIFVQNYGPIIRFTNNLLKSLANRSKSVNIYIEYNKMLYKYDRIDQNHMGQFDHLRTFL